jgi:hypothetical protein
VRIANQIFSLAAEKFVNEQLFAYRTYCAKSVPEGGAPAVGTRARAMPGSTRRRYEQSVHADVRDSARIVGDASPLDLYLQFVRMVANVSHLIAFEELVDTDDQYRAKLRPIAVYVAAFRVG